MPANELMTEAKAAQVQLMGRLRSAMRLAKDCPSVEASKMQGLREYFNRMPRSIWGEVLQIMAPSDPRAADMLTAIAEPSASMKSVALLAAENGIEMFHLAGWVETWYEHFNRMLLQEEMFYVLRDIATDARNHDEPCPNCIDGTTEEGKRCRKCAGSGKITIHGDRHARRQLLEAAGVIQGLKVGVQVNNFPSHGQPAQDLLALAQDAINMNYQRRERMADVIEGEVVTE